MSEENKIVSEEQKTEARRDFIKKTAYIAPVIMTMPAIASTAATGSNGTTSGTGYGYYQPNNQADCAVGGQSEFHVDCTG